VPALLHSADGWRAPSTYAHNTCPRIALLGRGASQSAIQRNQERRAGSVRCLPFSLEDLLGQLGAHLPEDLLD
jgi:hypothetical protein